MKDIEVGKVLVKYDSLKMISVFIYGMLSGCILSSHIEHGWLYYILLPLVALATFFLNIVVIIGVDKIRKGRFDHFLAKFVRRLFFI